jgi:hypothetical protein
VSKRPLPDWHYAYPDGRNERIKELEAEVVMLRAFLKTAKARLAKYERKRGKK